MTTASKDFDVPDYEYDIDDNEEDKQNGGNEK